MLSPGLFVTVTAAHEDDGDSAFCLVVVVFMVVGSTGDWPLQVPKLLWHWFETSQ